MKYKIAHENRGRLRIIVGNGRLSESQANLIASLPQNYAQIESVRIKAIIGSVTIQYRSGRNEIISIINAFSLQESDGSIRDSKAKHVASARKLNQEYEEKVFWTLAKSLLIRNFAPMPLRIFIATKHFIHFSIRALSAIRKKKLNMEVLDAVSLGMALSMGDYTAAGSAAYMLLLSEILEEWIEKKKAESLVETMLLDVDQVWLVSGEEESHEIQITSDQVKIGDVIAIHQGEMIPFDGVVVSGQAMISQAGMTGNSITSVRQQSDQVLAGSIVEDGELRLKITEKEDTRLGRVLTLVDRNENLRPQFEVEAMRKSNRIVPYLLSGGIISWLLTRNMAKASAFFDVDLSFGLKTALPAAVLKARNVAVRENMIVRGGNFMELISKADIFVFDKTGTLTKQIPELREVVSAEDGSRNDLLSIAVCLEEYYDSIHMDAIVRAAKEAGISADDLDYELEFVLDHGIAATINGRRIVMGSHHFVVEDEQCEIPAELIEVLEDEEHLQDQHVFIGAEGKVSGIFCIEDPIKEDALQVMEALRSEGVESIHMLTGDYMHSAWEAAEQLHVDDFRFEMLPEEKGEYISNLQKEGHVVVMVGDGVNDALALSKADVGIALQSGSDIPCEIADIVIQGDALYDIVKLVKISKIMIRRMRKSVGSIYAITMTDLITELLGIFPGNGISILENVLLLGTSLANWEDYKL